MVRRSSTERFDRIEHLRDRVTLHQADLLDQRSLVDALRAAKPDEIYNLAAMSFVAVSWIQPTLTAEFTGVGVTRMLEAVREVCPEARFYQASSSEMFGKVREVPQTEDDALLPALALRGGQGLRPLHHRQLPRVLQPARDQRDPLQPRVFREQTPLIVRDNGVVAREDPGRSGPGRRPRAERPALRAEGRCSRYGTAPSSRRWLLSPPLAGAPAISTIGSSPWRRGADRWR